MSHLRTPFCTSFLPLSLVPSAVPAPLFASSASSASALRLTHEPSSYRAQLGEAMLRVDAKDETCVVCYASFGKGDSELNPTRLMCCLKRLCFPCIAKWRKQESKMGESRRALTVDPP